MSGKHENPSTIFSKRGIAVVGYFLILFFVLFIICLYRPTLSNPPRSDYRCLFYYFHDYQNLPVLERFMEVMNYDVWQHGTYRPFFHLVEPTLILGKEVDLDSLWQGAGAELEKLIIVGCIIALLVMAGGCYFIYRKDRSTVLMPSPAHFLPSAGTAEWPDL